MWLIVNHFLAKQQPYQQISQIHYFVNTDTWYSPCYFINVAMFDTYWNSVSKMNADFILSSEFKPQYNKKNLIEL